MTNATLKIYPNKDKISKKSNTIPVYFRIMVKGKKAEGKIPNIMLEIQEFELWNPLFQMVNDPKAIVNQKITIIKSEFERILSNNSFESTSLTSMQIRDFLLKRNEFNTDKKEQEEEPSVKIIPFFDEYYKSIVLPSVNWSKATKKIYNKAINHFKYFLNHNNLNELTFKDIKAKQAFLFKTYLVSTIEKVEVKGEVITKVGISNESASQIVKKIKSIFNAAIDEDLLETNPFSNVKIATKFVDNSRNLTILEIKKLYQSNLSHRTSLELCRDLFLFQSFSGMAFIDMYFLQENQISNITHDKLQIKYVRRKTKIPARLVVNSYLLELINKFKSNYYPKKQGFVVPTINMQEYNNRLKILSDNFGLSIIDLSSHIGRHNFRQQLDEAQIIDAWSIHKFMGWSFNSINRIYTNGNDRMLINANALFEKYLDEYLKPTNSTDTI